jgi:hypothetical protein
VTEQRSGAETAQAIRAFLATHDGRVATWQVVMQIRERLHSELYRREREVYPEFVDLGGEA